MLSLANSYSEDELLAFDKRVKSGLNSSDEIEYVREAVTDEVNGPNRSNPEGNSTPEPAIDLATGDLSVILEAPAAGAEAEVAQELDDALQQESERFEQDRKQLIETLDESLVHFQGWEHGMGCHKKLPKEQELMQMPGRGKLDFVPIDPA